MESKHYVIFQFQEGVLLDCFADLRQLLDLLVSEDWATYLADYGSNPSSKYRRVQPITLLTILEKIKEADGRNVFANMMNKRDRDKRRLVDTVYKQLKTLVANKS